MAVTTSYSLNFVTSLTPSFITTNSVATSLSNGGFAVVGDHTTHIDGSYYSSAGALVASPTGFAGTNGSVAQLGNGNIVVVGDGGTDIFFRITDGNGGTVVASTGIGESGADVLNPDVAGGIPGNRFVIAYQDFFGGTDSDINWEIRNSDGTIFASGAPNSATTINDQFPSVSVLNDGGFVIAWQRNVGSETEIWYSVINANGTVRLAETQLDAFGTINRLPTTVALQDGGFAIIYEDNGWNGDRDITYARFNANGAFQTWTDISNNTVTDADPSATVLSNGLVLVGSTNSVFADTDPTWTLVDPTSGAILTSSSLGFTFNNDFLTAVAGMSLGKVATLASDQGSGTVKGSILQTTRTSISDAASDTITVDSLRDVVIGGAGFDTIQGSGLVSFDNDSIDGGADTDRILATGDISLVNTTVISIEEIEFQAVAPGKTVTIRADQVGAGLASSLVVDFSAVGTPDVFQVLMLADTSVDLSQFQIQDFDPAGVENARIVIVGDGDSETILGTSVSDEMLGNGGNDILSGNGGNDVMRGGAGNDTYGVHQAGDIVDESVAGSSGIDTVNAVVTVSLLDVAHFKGTIENVTLFGAGNINATGSNGANVLIGNSGNNTLNGNSGADTMRGMAGNDLYGVHDITDIVDESVAGSAGIDTVNSTVNMSLVTVAGAALGKGNVENITLFGAANIFAYGNALANVLIGNAGNNTLAGGLGNDTLTGNGGNDIFVFNTAPNAATNRDNITDMNQAGNDTIHLENAVFVGLAAGALAAGAFVSNGTGLAGDANDRIIYNVATGQLFFDSNGNAAGGSVQFALLDAGLAMSAADFFVI